MKNLLIVLLALTFTESRAQTPLFIPPSLTGTTFNLNIQNGTRTFFTGYNTPTYGINGAMLAPTLILNKYDSVNINVTNNLSVTTTIHWHGLHVPAVYDGGPGQLITPSATWKPGFKVLNDAGTFWYHPHGAGKTDLHVSKGIAGMIIVKDPVEAALNLPRTYGVDDIPVIVQSKAFDILRQIAIATEEDTLMMVNGTVDPYLDAPAQVMRFRILNGSSMRSYMFGFSANYPFKLIATDGGLIDTPVSLTRLRLSPGERAEILVNLTGMSGQTIYLKSYASELPKGIYGADTVGTDSAVIPDYYSNPLNGSDFNIMKINVIAPTTGAVTSIPTTLTTITPWPISSVDTIRRFNFDPETPDSSKLAEGPFVINGHHFSMDTVNVVTFLNHTEIWTLANHTMVAHPFHIHDVQFYILDINGIPPPLYERGKKDVVLVMPGDTVRFITKFETYADANTPYMYHCHLLHHEDDGMMGQFIVSPGPENVTEPTKSNALNIYPNPANNQFYIVPNTNNSATEIMINDITGKLMYTTNITKPIEINTIGWPKGCYIIKSTNQYFTSVQKLIVE